MLNLFILVSPSHLVNLSVLDGIHCVKWHKFKHHSITYVKILYCLHALSNIYIPSGKNDSVSRSRFFCSGVLEITITVGMKYYEINTIEKSNFPGKTCEINC